MIDLFPVPAFVAYLIVVGFQSHRKAPRNLRSFCLASGEVRGWKVGLGMAADTNSPKLKRRLELTVLTAISLFLILIGLVRLLIHLPWISLLWGWGALLAGIALVPLW